MRMWCTRCGLERSSENTAADTGSCRCGGSQFQSWPATPWLTARASGSVTLRWPPAAPS
jgi:predicted  nucleic acid-binding Zn-ribbon protein